jgi:hypothetical protein
MNALTSSSRAQRRSFFAIARRLPAVQSAASSSSSGSNVTGQYFLISFFIAVIMTGEVGHPLSV